MQRAMPFIFTFTLLLSACTSLPPFFVGLFYLYAAQGNNVDISVDISGSPTSVGCSVSSTAITMSSTDNYTYTGTVDQSLLSLGENPVSCSATNDNGTTTQTAGVIKVIENTPPTLVTLTPVSVYDNDGSVALDEPLVDTGNSSNLDGAEFTLDASSDALPAGLSIDSANGNLVGSTDVASTQVLSIILKATSAAGSDINDTPTDLTINDGANP